MAKRTNVRKIILAIMFIAVLVAYFDRVNLSVATPFIMKEMGIDKVQMGWCMSAFLGAYAIMQIPGGLLSEKFGVRKMGCIAIVFWSIFTFLTPMAKGFGSFFAVRAMFGIGEAPIFPANGILLAKWFSKGEKALSSSIMVTGAFIGPALGTPIAVFIVSMWGWRAVFEIFAFIGLLIAAAWYYFIRNYPSEHPKCNDEEVMFITGETSVDNAPKLEAAPWKKFLTSSQFWGIGLQYAVINYIMYMFLSWLPLYYLEAKGMNLKAMGAAAAYPWIAICAFLILGGIVSDKLVKSGHSKFQARTCFAIVGLAGCGIGLYTGSVAVSPTLNIVALAASLGFAGLTYTAAWSGCQDLGQRHGGMVVSWMNTWANVGGFFAPIITAVLVKHYGWTNALTITSFIVIFGIFLWLLVKPDKPLVTD